jgi:hypothetical protein
MITTAQLILYVQDERERATVYPGALAPAPSFHAPGMTEFQLTEDWVLGLMPVAAVRRLLDERLPNPSRAAAVPRARLHLPGDGPATHQHRAVAAGAVELSGLHERNWGDMGACPLDLDGHLVPDACPAAAR